MNNRQQTRGDSILVLVLVAIAVDFVVDGKAIVAGYLGALVEVVVDSKVEGGVDLQIEIRTQ